MNHRTGDKIIIGGDYQYNAYYKGSVPQRFWHKFKISAAMTNLALRPGKNILDAGCGSGMLSAFIAKDDPAIQVTGLDGNAEAIRFCRQQWKDLPNLRFIQGMIDQLGQFADASMDGVAFLEVIEHITEKQADYVLSEFYRILKQDGVLVISTPNRKSLWPLLEYIMDLFHLAPRLKDAQHEKLYSEGELTNIAYRNGLTPLKLQRINFIAPWIASFSAKLAHKAHNWETRHNRLPGSLLFHTYRKIR
jgi:ubiquinone/menaquinone biosynthesis C-methylase UbiE